MTLEDSIHSQRLRVLRDAERLGNASEACRRRLVKQLNRKVSKLASYATTHRTLLLLEWQPELLSEHVVAAELRQAFGGALPLGIEAVWFTDSEGDAFEDLTSLVRIQWPDEMDS